MNKIIFIALIILQGQIAYSQQTDHEAGGDFQKTIEYNILVLPPLGYDTIYNLKNKSDLDRIFFGEINSPVEFVFHPSGEMREEIVGFRIRRKANNSCCLEVYHRPNIEEILRILSINTKKIVLPYELKAMKFISVQGEDWIKEYNDRIGGATHSGEIYQPYRPTPKTFNISDHFANELHAAIYTLIDTFRASGIPPSLIADGYEVTFRCVVDNELWTLRIHQPQYRAKLLSGIFRQLLIDASDTETLDESKYLELLDNIEL